MTQKKANPIAISISTLYRKNAIWHDSHTEEYGVTSAQIPVVICVCCNKRISQHELCLEMSLDKSVIARTTASLIKEGYLARDGKSPDKKSYMLIPTEKAWEVFPKMMANNRLWIETMTAGMTPEEIDMLSNLLSRAADNVKDITNKTILQK